jgi:YMGG-like Gly-zipper
MKHIDPRLAIALAATLALGGCVTPPPGPTVPVAPGPGKPFAAFNSDEATCRGYAESQTAPEAAAASNRAIGSAIIGSALGAGLGAAIGGGRGAAIGAASGAVAGTAYGANGSNWAQMSLQQQYNALYASCMAAHGNQVPGFAPPPGMPGYGGPPQGYGAPPQGYGAPPPGAPLPPPGR